LVVDVPSTAIGMGSSTNSHFDPFTIGIIVVKGVYIPWTYWNLVEL